MEVLDDIMQQIGCGEIWGDWICAIISSFEVSVLVNVALMKEFVMKKGFR